MSPDLTPAALDELAGLAAGATPGPWTAYDANEGDGSHRPLWSVANDAFHNPPVDDEGPWLAVNVETGTEADAAFIAAADPATVTALIDEVKRLRGDRAQLDAWLTEVSSQRIDAWDVQEFLRGEDS